jgi:AraC-like DNA-binding protein
MFSYIDLFLAMGFAWMISGILLLLKNWKENNGSLVSGIFLILIFGLTLADNFIKPNMLNPNLIRFIYMFSRNSYFLIGPLIWFYTRSLLLPERFFNKYDLLHFLSFILWSFFYLTSLEFQFPIINPQFVVMPPMHVQKGGIPFGFLRDFMSAFVRAVYSIYVLVLILKHSRSVSNFYSRFTTRNTLSWLFYLILFYVIIFLFNTVLFIFPFMPGGLMTIISAVVRILPSILFIFFFSFFAQNQPIPENRISEVSIRFEDKIKYTKSGLTSSESEIMFEELKGHLKKEKSFINSDLTLDELAKEINQSRHRLSEVINRQSSDNFYGFINSFRLKEFLDAIDKNRFPDFTILGIALECGFKSTSAFYAFFKKSMGFTPKEYIRNRQPK